MPSAWVLTSIAVLAGSFVAGFIIYFVLAPSRPRQRKPIMEDVLGTVINFIIYIWVGKIVVDLPTLIDDPLAVLAYPSGSAAFYLATLFTGVHLGLKVYKGTLDLWPHLQAFLYVFIGASFTFEFIDLVIASGGQNLGVLTLLLVLLLFMMVIQKRLTIILRVSLLVFLWGMGYTILSIWLPYVAVFDYMIAWWYFATFAVISGVVFMTYLKRKVSS